MKDESIKGKERVRVRGSERDVTRDPQSCLREPRVPEIWQGLALRAPSGVKCRAVRRLYENKTSSRFAWLPCGS